MVSLVKYLMIKDWILFYSFIRTDLCLSAVSLDRSELISVAIAQPTQPIFFRWDAPHLPHSASAARRRRHSCLPLTDQMGLKEGAT